MHEQFEMDAKDKNKHIQQVLYRTIYFLKKMIVFFQQIKVSYYNQDCTHAILALMKY